MTGLIIALTVAAVLLLLILFMIFPSRGGKQGRKDFYHLNIAHRGLHTPLPESEYYKGYMELLKKRGEYKEEADGKIKHIPENSLAAFRNAVEHGYGIELDIQLTKDEQVVVFHDDTLDRVCGVKGRVDAFTYKEICGMRLCGTDEKMPLFSEVLALVDGKVPLIVELKNGPKNKLLCKKGYELLSSYKGIFNIESFSPFIVQWFKKNAPDIYRGQLSSPSRELKREVPGFVAFLLGNLLTNFFARPQYSSYYKEKHSVTVKLAEALGAEKVCWTARPDDDTKKLEKTHSTVIFEFYFPETKY